MNKMRQPLLFATGTFFAVMLTIFGTIDLINVQKNQTGQTQSVGGSVSAGTYSCYRVSAPELEQAKILSFKKNGESISLNYPVTMEDFLKLEDYQFSLETSEENNNISRVYLNKALETSYELWWELPSGVKWTAPFVSIPCQK